MALTAMYNRQMGLKYVNYYYTGNIDSIEGPLMKKAYGLIQQAHGLTVDKIYGVNTDAALRADVKEAQQIWMLTDCSGRNLWQLLRRSRRRISSLLMASLV